MYTKHYKETIPVFVILPIFSSVSCPSLINTKSEYILTNYRNDPWKHSLSEYITHYQQFYVISIKFQRTPLLFIEVYPIKILIH